MFLNALLLVVVPLTVALAVVIDVAVLIGWLLRSRL